MIVSCTNRSKNVFGSCRIGCMQISY